MSIANEIERISDAKVNLRNALEARGAVVDENATIDSFAEILEDCPHVVRGFFTPEEDTKAFVIGNLPFTPHHFSFTCLELAEAPVVGAMQFGQMTKGNYGLIMSYNDTLNLSYMRIAPASGAVTWGDGNFSFTMPESRVYVFKAGYAYEYVICGGFEE